MPEYQKMYSSLFNEITDTIERLKKIQQDVEELYISTDEPIQLADYAKDK
ncbi:hypothetical protein EDD70_2115 [Hydrogenoanaerobacterium saccharovorans]|uniref:Uncharacterized protein n=1 Tax=Hydrogenoanaerobacterium saccharovorans TaxID=474960 RepID=A0A1H8CIQ2_9FIRM|nr:hypothetical protein [Hydrogenoanaerobacterium saccharovorans]RPF43155.1 hypothetical protein EDD70_2115 [Hydrogenoanaerobacterium saccharovorans]SEM95181.1 hypothetical protein SAMN05216180_2173 [Hydrogenoanaerobacterium saccharovorans]